MINVGAAAPHDCAALHRLIHEHAAYEQTGATITTQGVAELLASQNCPAHLLVARRADDVVGCASLTIDFSLWHGKAAYSDGSGPGIPTRSGPPIPTVKRAIVPT